MTPTPVTRRELFLAAASGQEIALPEPITREEMYLAEIARGGSGGTTDYDSLKNRPRINGVTLTGNLSPDDVGAVPAASVGVSGGVAAYDATSEGIAGVSSRVTNLEETHATTQFTSEWTTSLTLSANWSASNPHAQTVTISGVGAQSKVDLQASDAVLQQMESDGTSSIWIQNDNGVLTAYAAGAAPTVPLTVQVTVHDVASGAGNTYENIQFIINNWQPPMAIYDGIDLTQKFAAEIAASPYNGDAWAWIRARIRAGNFAGIHVADYIPFTTTNSVILQAQAAGISTYKNYGDTAVPNHIDFICKELWPTLKPANPVNYNNGLIPVENITSDGTTTSYTLTKEMNEVATITLGNNELSGWSYDASTFTITFEEAPAAGTLIVTGTGTEHPWLASDLYHWLNSLAGQIPNSAAFNPAVKHVDYTADGVYYYLPDELKAVIVEKRFLLSKRYSATGTAMLSSPNGWGWTNIGKLWLPTEPEVYGHPVWANNARDTGGSAVQYPIFAGNMRCVKYRNGTRNDWWLLTPLVGDTTSWCYIYSNGNAANDYASRSLVAAPVCFRVA